MGNRKNALNFDLSECNICGKPHPQIHHIFYGTSNRKNSEKYGYILPLCLRHHTGADGIHSHKDTDLFYKMVAQEHFEKNIGDRSEFIRIFGKSYL